MKKETMTQSNFERTEWEINETKKAIEQFGFDPYAVFGERTSFYIVDKIDGYLKELPEAEIGDLYVWNREGMIFPSFDPETGKVTGTKKPYYTQERKKLIEMVIKSPLFKVKRPDKYSDELQNYVHYLFRPIKKKVK